MFLRDKPVLYISQNTDLRLYDADDLDHELWQFKTVKEAGIELREDDFPRVTEIIKNAGDSVALSNARKIARETAWQHSGEAGKRVYEFMTRIANA
jgi:hypothetical protein